MDFAKRQRDPTRHLIGIGVVDLIHAVVIWALLTGLAAEYQHAQLCNVALHAFAAENTARMESMAAARNQIERQLSALQATQRLVRQEEITAEIIELAAGETASRSQTDQVRA